MRASRRPPAAEAANAAGAVSACSVFLRQTRHFFKGFSCFSCRWENICKNSFPCFVFAYSAYAPMHFLLALSKLGYKFLALESIQKKRQLRITFDNKKSFTFSVSLIISSTECIHIAQQLVLRWNLSKLPKDSCVKESLHRYYFLPKF